MLAINYVNVSPDAEDSLLLGNYAINTSNCTFIFNPVVSEHVAIAVDGFKTHIYPYLPMFSQTTTDLSYKANPHRVPIFFIVSVPRDGSAWAVG